MTQDIEDRIQDLVDKLNSLTEQELNLIHSHQERLKQVFDLRGNCTNLKHLVDNDRWGSDSKRLIGLIDKIREAFTRLHEDYSEGQARKLELIVTEEGRTLAELKEKESITYDDAAHLFHTVDQHTRKKLKEWLDNIKLRMKKEHIVFTAENHLNDLIQRFRDHQAVAVKELDEMINLLRKLEDAIYHKQQAKETAEEAHGKCKQLYELLREEKDSIIDPLEKFVKVKLTPEEKAKQLLKKKWFRFFNRIQPDDLKDTMKGFTQPDEAQRFLFTLSKHPRLLSSKAKKMSEVIIRHATAMIPSYIHQAKLAGLDELTNLPSRRQFNNDLADQMKKVRRGQGKYTFSLIMFDIDHFKDFNDKYGHDIGDEVLKTVARTVTKILRRETDKLYRTGGEEFHIIVACTKKDQATKIAERARKALEREEISYILPKDYQTGKLHMTISLGVSDSGEVFSQQYPIEKNAEMMLKLADQRLYKAKEGGRNRTVTQ